MKRLLIFIAIALPLIASCNNNTKHPATPTKLADYLYEITLDTVDETRYETFTGVETSQNAALCSSVRKGNFHGRNLDFFYDESCSVVLHMTKGQNRFASLAVIGCTRNTPEMMQNPDEELLQKLPFSTVDGINENGVACNVNVVMASDHAAPTGTNPGAKNLPAALVVRYVLDHAQTAANAIELLKERNIWGGMGDFAFHYMISDPTETYIVEIIDNELRYRRGEPVDNGNIMTNFYVTDLPNLGDHADGLERHSILTDRYDGIGSLEDMVEEMKSVRYSKAYDKSTVPFWNTEFLGHYTIDGVEYDFTVHNVQADTVAAKGLENSPEYKAFLKECDRQCTNYQTRQRDGSVWHTVSTSVYDLENLTLRLYVQEDYEHPFNFSLNK